MRRLLLALLLVLAPTVWLTLVTSASAEEAWCLANPAACVCSEPLNTATYASTDWSIGGPCTGANGCFHNPADSTTKQCSHEGTNAPISTYNDYHGSNNAVAKAALPPGHSVQFFGARGESGHSGTWWGGAESTINALGATFNARMSFRFYHYGSPDLNFRDDTPPCHSKFLQGFPAPWHLENAYGDIHMYEFTNPAWGPGSAFPRDCCSGTPGAAIAFTKAMWKGRWWFFEVVTTNRSGPGWRTILYARDVTAGPGKINNGVEFVATDTFGTVGGFEPWTSAFNTVVTSNPRQHPMKFNGFREVSAGGGQCNGFRGISYMVVAGWDTDAGQRIGAATEVEGGGTPPPTAPTAPTGLTVSPSSLVAPTLLLAFMGWAGRAWHRRRRA